MKNISHFNNITALGLCALAAYGTVSTHGLYYLKNTDTVSDSLYNFDKGINKWSILF